MADKRYSVDVESAEDTNLEPSVKVGDPFVQTKRMTVGKQQELPVSEFVKIGESIKGFSKSLATMMDSLKPTTEEERAEAEAKANKILRERYEDHKDFQKLYVEADSLKGTFSDFQWRVFNTYLGNKFANDFNSSVEEKRSEYSNPDKYVENLREQIASQRDDFFVTNGQKSGFLDDDNFSRAYYEATDSFLDTFEKQVKTEYKERAVQLQIDDAQTRIVNEFFNYLSDDSSDTKNSQVPLKFLDEEIFKLVDEWKGDFPDQTVSNLTKGIFIAIANELKSQENLEDLEEFHDLLENQITNAEASKLNGSEFKVNIKGLNTDDAQELLREVERQLVSVEELSHNKFGEKQKKLVEAINLQSGAFLATDAFKVDYAEAETVEDKKRILSDFLKSLTDEDGKPLFEDVDGDYFQQTIGISINALDEKAKMLVQGKNQAITQNLQLSRALIPSLRLDSNYPNMSISQQVDWLREQSGQKYSEVEEQLLIQELQKEQVNITQFNGFIGYNPQSLLKSSAMLGPESMAYVWEFQQQAILEKSTDKFLDEGMGGVNPATQAKLDSVQSYMAQVMHGAYNQISRLSPLREDYAQKIEEIRESVKKQMDDFVKKEIEKQNAKDQEGKAIDISEVEEVKNVVPFNSESFLKGLPKMSSDVYGNNTQEQAVFWGMDHKEFDSFMDVVVDYSRTNELKAEDSEAFKNGMKKLKTGSQNTLNELATNVQGGQNIILHINRKGFNGAVTGDKVDPWMNKDSVVKQEGASALDRFFNNHVDGGDYLYTTLNEEGNLVFKMTNVNTDWWWAKNDVTELAQGDRPDVNFNTEGLSRLEELISMSGEKYLNQYIEKREINLGTESSPVRIPFTEENILNLFSPKPFGLTSEKRTLFEWTLFADEAKQKSETFMKSRLGQYWTMYNALGGDLSAYEYVRMEANTHNNLLLTREE